MFGKIARGILHQAVIKRTIKCDLQCRVGRREGWVGRREHLRLWHCTVAVTRTALTVASDIGLGLPRQSHGKLSSAKGESRMLAHAVTDCREIRRRCWRTQTQIRMMSARECVPPPPSSTHTHSCHSPLPSPYHRPRLLPAYS